MTRFLESFHTMSFSGYDGFSTENLIGEGGFSSVYKGILDYDDGRFVAVKVLHLQNRGAHKSFLAECEAWRELFGHPRLLGTDLNQNSSTGVKGTIGYAPPEYGIGSKMTSSGDVYSFGILLLELMTGKKRRRHMFNEGLSIHKFASMALTDHVTNVIDDDAIMLQSTEANAKKEEECLVAIIKIRVSCSMDSPPQRMKTEIVVTELQSLIPSLLGEVESNCNKEQFMSFTTTIAPFPGQLSGLSPVTCRWGKVSPATCRSGMLAGEAS
ncbi:kinase-like domain-containing protein [Tanacetum coccineum]